MRHNEEYTEYLRDLKQVQDSLMQSDTWLMYQNIPLIQVDDKDLHKIIKGYRAFNMRNFFDRVDTNEGPIFETLIEVTAFIDAERIWCLVRIDEDFLVSLEQNRTIRFGNQDDFVDLPLHDQDGLINSRVYWDFLRNDDEWFKAKREHQS